MNQRVKFSNEVGEALGSIALELGVVVEAYEDGIVLARETGYACITQVRNERRAQELMKLDVEQASAVISELQAALNHSQQERELLQRTLHDSQRILNDIFHSKMWRVANLWRRLRKRRNAVITDLEPPIHSLERTPSAPSWRDQLPDTPDDWSPRPTLDMAMTLSQSVAEINFKAVEVFENPMWVHELDQKSLLPELVAAFRVQLPMIKET